MISNGQAEKNQRKIKSQLLFATRSLDFVDFSRDTDRERLRTAKGMGEVLPAIEGLRQTSVEVLAAAMRQLSALILSSDFQDSSRVWIGGWLGFDFSESRVGVFFSWSFLFEGEF